MFSAREIRDKDPFPRLEYAHRVTAGLTPVKNDLDASSEVQSDALPAPDIWFRESAEVGNHTLV